MCAGESMEDNDEIARDLFGHALIAEETSSDDDNEIETRDVQTTVDRGTRSTPTYWKK